jgi:hypothetical protein
MVEISLQNPCRKKILVNLSPLSKKECSILWPSN